MFDTLLSVTNIYFTLDILLLTANVRINVFVLNMLLSITNQYVYFRYIIINDELIFLCIPDFNIMQKL